MSTINACITNNRKKFHTIVSNIKEAPFPIKGRFVKLTNDILVYKKVYIGPKNCLVPGIATLVVPAGTIVFKSRIGSDQDKCRAEKAIVVKVETKEGKEVPRGLSMHQSRVVTDRSRYIKSDDGYHRYIYKALTVATPEYGYSFDSAACRSGIHFFMTKELALNY